MWGSQAVNSARKGEAFDQRLNWRRQYFGTNMFYILAIVLIESGGQH